MWGARFGANRCKPEDHQVPQKTLTRMKDKIEKEKEGAASCRLKEFRHLESKCT
jgi:hypothetical protein